MDRLKSFEVFCRVAELGGFAVAARKLNISPTMASEHVQALEARIGARLLNRSTRRVSLTDAGRLVHERCLQILADIEETEASAGALHGGPRGLLRINTSIALGERLAPFVVAFAGQYPDLQVDLQATDRFVDLVEEGFDVSFRIGPVPSSSYILRRVAPVPMAVCGSPDYFARRSAPEHPDDLVHHDCVNYSRLWSGNFWEFVVQGKVRSIAIGGPMQSNNLAALRAAALGGRGLVLLPAFALGRELGSGALIQVLRDYPTPDPGLNAVYPHRRQVSAKVRLLLEHLEGELKRG